MPKPLRPPHIPPGGSEQLRYQVDGALRQLQLQVQGGQRQTRLMRRVLDEGALAMQCIIGPQQKIVRRRDDGPQLARLVTLGERLEDTRRTAAQRRASRGKRLPVASHDGIDQLPPSTA